MLVSWNIISFKLGFSCYCCCRLSVRYSNISIVYGLTILVHENIILLLWIILFKYNYDKQDIVLRPSDDFVSMFQENRWISTIEKSIRKMESTKANNYWCQFYHLFSSFRLFCGQDEWCPNITTFIRLIFKTKTNSYLFVHKNKAKSGIDSTHKDMFSLTLSDRCQVTDDRWQVTGDSRHSKSRFLLRGQLLTLKKIAIENAQKYSKSHIKGAKTWRKKKVKMHEFSGLSVHISRVCANSAKFCAGTGDLLAIKCLPEQWYPPWNKHEHKQYQTTWLRLN